MKLAEFKSRIKDIKIKNKNLAEICYMDELGNTFDVEVEIFGNIVEIRRK